jgi:phenylpyruvate tautomerase PptA (4-oxalocrotonate tautomerase family)
MSHIIIHHKVKDYNAWRPGYDAHEKSRLAAGITNARVFRSAEDPNDLVILADVIDESKARSWTASEDLKSAMQAAGVIGPPFIHFVP